MDVDDPLDTAAVHGAEAVADRRQVHGAVRHEPLAVGQLREPGLAHDHLGARALEPGRHGLAEAERRRGRHGFDGIGAVRPHRGRGRAVEVDIGELAEARGQRHSLFDDLTVHALARGVEGAREIDHVAELQRAYGLGRDGRRELDFVHLHVVEATDLFHSMPCRR